MELNVLAKGKHTNSISQERIGKTKINFNINVSFVNLFSFKSEDFLNREVKNINVMFFQLIDLHSND